MGGLQSCQKKAERQMPALNIETEIDGLQGAGSESGSKASRCWEPHPCHGFHLSFLLPFYPWIHLLRLGQGECRLPNIKKNPHGNLFTCSPIHAFLGHFLLWEAL